MNYILNLGVPNDFKQVSINIHISMSVPVLDAFYINPNIDIL